ncbi:MAG TPA: S41 family peptidase [Candidatus Sulfotelmatobacter sp.]|jgi:carboxyl-terminal processing protease|nr:S41 family peptidase [Candidatus Sulfotelmatobacter sp.]
MNRRFIFGLVITVLLLNLAIGAQVYLMAAGTQKDGRDAEDAELQVFSQVLDQVHDEYVDGKDATYQQLIHTALKGMVNQLDPHSEFLDASSYHRLQDDTEGQFGGLGLVVGARDGYVTVITPMDDTPGSRAGIIAGDRIVKVNGIPVEKAVLDEVVSKLRGAPDTQVTVSIERPSTGVTKDYTLTRAVIQMPMIKDLNGKKEFSVDGNKIGYVRITQFGDGTADELEDALQKLQGQGMRGLIIDLRWNPGGLLDEAVAVCQKFLPRDTLIVSTEGRHTIEKYFAKGSGDELKGMPIVILANLGSASAAEIVTGCLQDLHRAVVLGEKTFGKGSVQTIFPLNDGSALKLTVAKYYTPSHKVIHEHGITPDVAVPVTDFEEAALMMQRSPGGIESLPEKVQPEVRAVHDTQLERAEDLIKGLLIYSSLNPVPEKVAAK